MMPKWGADPLENMHGKCAWRTLNGAGAFEGTPFLHQLVSVEKRNIIATNIMSRSAIEHTFTLLMIIKPDVVVVVDPSLN
jgi:hypothetical protein